MADLGNSRRISYKATYNQISGSSVVSESAGIPRRAMEKAAFIQSLRLRTKELAAIRRGLSREETPSAAHEKALRAVARLVADETATSTLNHAAEFSEVTAQALAEIARAVIGRRRRTGAQVDSVLTSMGAAHRKQLRADAGQDPSTPKPQPAGTAATTSSGLAVRVSAERRTETETEAASRRRRATEESTITVRLDDSAGTPKGLGGDLPAAARPSGEAALSTGEAIAWAQEHSPKHVDELGELLSAYLDVDLKAVPATAVPAALTRALAAFAAVNTADEADGAVEGFTSRMAIEPIGNLHLERVEMYPSGVERGELVHSLPLAPGETVNISHKEWSVTQREFEELVHDYFEGYSEEGVAEKTDIALSTDSQSQHSTALNIGASLSASYSSVTLSSTFGYTASANDALSRKDSRNHSIGTTKKASSRTQRDHKVTFKVTSVAGSEDQSVRVLSNPSTTDAMRLDYFQLARKWKVDLLRYGLRMTYDIVIPNPGSSIATLVQSVRELDALIDTPFAFRLRLDDIFYHSLAPDPHDVSNYDRVAARYEAAVTAPPQARQWVHVHKELAAEVDDYDDVYFDSIEADIDPDYYVYQVVVHSNYEHNQGDTRSYLRALDSGLDAGIAELIGQSGHLSFDFMFQYLYKYAINVTFICRPKVQALLEWRLKVWNEIRQAAELQYAKRIQLYKDERSKIIQQIADFDALTLRRMEQEEIMKGVLRWLLGPSFDLVPSDVANLFGHDTNEPGLDDVLDPSRLSDSEWLHVLERGEFIKYLHNAIEWENVLYFTYPYFWDDTSLWAFKKYLYHPDPTHRKFLRSGSARVVLTIRPGFEASFTSLVESGSFGTLPGPHPYVSIAQEMRNFARTNYPGFPPANPEQNARPLLYLEQRRVWREMQYIVQLLEACKAATGSYPVHGTGNSLPAAQLTPFLNGPVVINGTTFNGVNDYNTQTNTTQLALDPAMPADALLPTYATVPVKDVSWNNAYFYACPGSTGDYDLICLGADGAPGGQDKDADISANAEATLIATWYEYTPINALDLGITTNPPNTVPQQPSSDIA